MKRVFPRSMQNVVFFVIAVALVVDIILHVAVLSRGEIRENTIPSYVPVNDETSSITPEEAEALIKQFGSYSDAVMGVSRQLTKYADELQKTSVRLKEETSKATTDSPQNTQAVP